MARVFISHKSDDEPAARRIAAALRRADHLPWLSEDEILPGESIVGAVQRGLVEADYVVVCLSQRALLSGWIEAELQVSIWQQFSHSQERVLPVRLEKVPVPAIIGHLLYLDLFPEERWQPSIDRLLTAIRVFEQRRGIAVDATRSVDWLPYLSVVAEENGYLNIAGIGSGAGRVKSATRYPIEKLYTPLAVRGGDFAGFDDESHESLQALERGPAMLADLLPRHARLLIEGQPGAGKTTFVRLVAAVLARDGQGIVTENGAPWRQRYLGLDPSEPARIPILLKIADLIPILVHAPSTRVIDHRILLDLLDNICKDNQLAITREQWQALLADGRGHLLLDGLDEVADEQLRQRVFAVFRDASKTWPTCPMVVTSRPTATAAIVEMGFHPTMVEPFADPEMREFIARWVGALHDVEPGDALPTSAGRYRQELLDAITNSAAIRRLATNPVMLTCLCVVHWNEGRLPKGRARAYRAVLRWLLGARSNLRMEEGFTDRFAHLAFARLAFALMTTDKGKQPVIDLHAGAMAIDEIVARQFPNLNQEERCHKGKKFLSFECLGSGILEEVKGNRLKFWHLTFQEYLAAMQLAWRGDSDDIERDWWPVVKAKLDDPQWRETIELFPGVLLDEGGEGRVDRLLERVLGLLGQKPSLADEARVAGIVGQLLEPLEAYDYQPPPAIKQAFDQVREKAMAIFEPDGAKKVPVKTRILAAEALGRGGDPRLREGHDNFIPIPGTNIALGKYLVTVEEYQRFVEHRGYDEERFWDVEGWRFRQEHTWEAPDNWAEQLRAPNRPVVNVSWYEASAYCRWLSENCSATVRLPTEKEWTSAASPDGRKYPWGNDEPNAERANFNRNAKRATPVGIYPAGNGKFGHCDLGGNVWEWSADERKDGERPEKERKDWGPRMSLRGGSWAGSAVDLLTAGRGWGGAWNRVGSIGFRLCRGPREP